MVVYTVLVMAANNLTIDGFQLLDLKILTNSWPATNHSIEDDKKAEDIYCYQSLEFGMQHFQGNDIELIVADTLIN